jgi:hypothetical protein
LILPVDASKPDGSRTYRQRLEVVEQQIVKFEVPFGKTAKTARLMEGLARFWYPAMVIGRCK